MPLAKSNDNPAAFGIGAIFIGGGLIFTGLKNFLKGRKIQDTARIDIGSAPQGLVEVEGYAWSAGQTMVAACGRDVVYYHYKVQQYVKRGKSSSWETKHEFNFCKPFFVIDSSGVCLVEPLKNHMEVREIITSLRGYAEDPINLYNMIRQGPGGFFSSMFSGKYRLVENKILVGSPVYANGEMRPINAKVKIKGAYKKFLERVRAARGNPVFRLQKFDKNRDGKLSDLEMLEGLSDTSKEVTAGAGEELVSVAGVIANSEAHSLILGDCHQEELLKRVSSYNVLKILGGILLIGGGIFILQNLSRI